MLEYKELSFNVKEFNEETGEFEGYASTRDVDLGNDKVMEGAFMKCLDSKEYKDIDILYSHDSKEIIGEPVILVEDQKGLFVKANLYVDGIQRAKEVKYLMKKNKLNKMSIGYRVKDYQFNKGVRELKEVDLVEISVVRHPMNPEANITGVKSVMDLPEFKSLSDVSDFLKTLGCSNNASDLLISKITEFKTISDEGEPQEKESIEGEPHETKTEPKEVHAKDDKASLALSELLNNLKNK